jgi:hypothetical protein
MNRMHLLVFTFPLLLLGGGAGQQPDAPGLKDAGVRRDTTPPSLSLYLPIPLGVPGTEDPATGVFVPQGYRAGQAVDVVVFLRGYDVLRPKPATPVAAYWNSPRHPVLKSFLLREEVNRSGRNVLLVVPALGPYAEAGKLTEAAGFKEFLGRVFDGLRRHGPHAGLARPPELRHLILAAHSGGGAPLRRLAQALGGDDAYKTKLKACWGFDCLYGVKDKDAEFWAGWAAAHPGAQVAMFYLHTDKEVGKDPKRPVGPGNPVARRVPTGTTGQALELEGLAAGRKLANVAVVRGTRETTLDHTEVPRAHLAGLLRKASYLEDR